VYKKNVSSTSLLEEITFISTLNVNHMLAGPGIAVIRPKE